MKAWRAWDSVGNRPAEDLDAAARCPAASADAVIAISGELADALAARGVTSEQVKRIPNGIDLRRWLGEGHGKSELRQRLSLPNRVLVTYCGRLSRAKGLVMLVNVWRRIAATHPQAHLLLIGSGDRLTRV